MKSDGMPQERDHWVLRLPGAGRGMYSMSPEGQLSEEGRLHRHGWGQ